MMSDIRKIRLPLPPEEARELKLGELVIADGEAIITAGLPTHERIVDYLDKGKPLPLALNGQAFFHMGICVEERGDRIQPLYLNPTTSTRFSAQMPSMIRRLGLTAVAGKGGLDRMAVHALRETGGVYFSMVGGASSMLSAAVTDVVETAWPDLITQFRLTRIRFSGLGPLVVAIDAHGGSLYEQLADEAQRKLPSIKANLSTERSGSA